MKKLRLMLSCALVLVLQSCAYNETTDEFETTWLFWFLLVVLVFSGIVGMKSAQRQTEEREERAESLSRKTSEQQFNISAQVTDPDKKFNFIVDEVKEVVAIVRSTVKTKLIPFLDIMGVEVQEDGTVIQSKSLARTAGGALVGNMIAGGAGMIVGGLSGDSKQKKKVSKISVVIKLRQISEPSITLVCFDAMALTGQKEISTTSSISHDSYQAGVNAANKIAELLGVIIDANNRQFAAEAAEEKAVTQNQDKSSVLDELNQLIAMKEKGLINDEEFASLKSKLLK